MKYIPPLFLFVLIAGSANTFIATAHGQTYEERLEQLKQWIPQHPDYPGALNPDNLSKERPEAPFNLTGTWFPDLSGDFNKWLFGSEGYPEFIGQAKLDFEEGQQARAEGRPYRDAIGQCFPAGIPMIMTRVWPIAMVQLPTVLYMVSNFNNSFRQIFLDGRDYSDPDYVIYTYNGESIGHWEGGTLVVDTIGYADHREGNALGLPSGEGKHTVERFTLNEDGASLRYEILLEDAQYLAEPVSYAVDWEYRPALEPSSEACDLDVARRFLSEQ